jgi:hypothetical protein
VTLASLTEVLREFARSPQVNDLEWFTTDSLKVLSSSLFIDHTTIERYVASALKASLNNQKKLPV